MNNLTEQDVEKKVYVVPALNMICFGTMDIVCLSKEESYDNDFDAGDLGL